jgi:hypothetical protein
MKNFSHFEWQSRSKDGREHVQDDSRSGHPKGQKTDADVNSGNLVRSGRGLGVRLIAEEGYGNLLGGKHPCGLTSGFYTMTVPLGMMC